jgi:hypothetical protein
MGNPAGSLPRTRFHAPSLYFLASDVRKLKIGRNGITFNVGKRRFNYKGKETGEREGDTIYAWFNAQRPESLPCTSDLSGKGLFVVERSHELPAVGASRELLASENAKAGAHRGYAADLYHTVENALPPSAFRGQTLDRKGLRLGAEIETRRQEIDDRNRAGRELDRDISRKARRAGISPIIVPQSRDALESLDELAIARADLNRKIEEESSHL